MPLVIDSDTGINDAMGLIYALSAEGSAVSGITTLSGNVHRDHCTRNALRIVELTGATVPVLPGAERPLSAERVGDAGHVHGPTGTGYLEEPPPAIAPDPRTATEFLLEQVRTHGGELTIVSAGPWTNIATAVLAAPDLFRDAQPQLVWMGGSFHGIGNITPVAEFNAFCDPEAAAIVLAAGLPVTMLPLDVTERAPREPGSVCLLDSDCAALERSAQPAARYLARISGQYRDFYTEVWGERGCAMHSALVVAVALDPTLVRVRETAAVTVSTEVATRGMTIWDRRYRRGRGTPTEPSNVTIVTDVNGPGFKESFLRRLGADTPPAPTTR